MQNGVFLAILPSQMVIFHLAIDPIDDLKPCLPLKMADQALLNVNAIAFSSIWMMGIINPSLTGFIFEWGEAKMVFFSIVRPNAVWTLTLV